MSKTTTVTIESEGPRRFNNIIIDALQDTGKVMVQCPFTWNKFGHRSVRWGEKGNIVAPKALVRWKNGIYQLTKAKIRDHGNHKQIIFILEI